MNFKITKLFKTKEEKLSEAKLEVERLNAKFEDGINSYCKIRDYIFIFKGFKLIDDKISITFVDKDTPAGLLNYIEPYFWEMKYGNSNFSLLRNNFITFKDHLNKIGLNIVLDEDFKKYLKFIEEK